MRKAYVGFVQVFRPVPDNTVHLSHTPPLFGTRGNLILNMIILFLYFILQVKPRLETSQEALPPHQTAGNVINSNPSRSASPRSRKGGYVKILAMDPTESNTGFFLPSFFVLLFPAMMPLTSSQPIPHGDDRLYTAAPPAPMPNQEFHRETNNPR